VRILRPLASSPSAAPSLRDNLAAALTMAGRQDEAARILGASLTQDEVRQALEAYAEGSKGPRAAR
jgi:Flp pilus assembly protein TadD